MKYEWRKNEKTYYGATEQPVFLTLPQQNYIMIEGKGNPNQEDFFQRISVLYSLSYQIKFQWKALCSKAIEDMENIPYQDYSVFPLEGVWSCADAKNPLNKDQFLYTIMIKQPEFITEALFHSSFETVSKKKPHPLLKEVFFSSLTEGDCLQMLHKGSYDDEIFTFDKMDACLMENGFKRSNSLHREIYLSDARKTLPEKRKTILRYQIEKDT